MLSTPYKTNKLKMIIFSYWIFILTQNVYKDLDSLMIHLIGVSGTLMVVKDEVIRIMMMKKSYFEQLPIIVLEVPSI